MHSMVQHVRKTLFLILIIGLLSLSILTATFASAHNRHKALIPSSLEKLVPTRGGDLQNIESPLTNAGYTITYLADNQVTVNLLATQLNDYDVIIWRTNTYDEAHLTYWYVGETTSEATLREYASDFASRSLDNSHGIIGANVDFFQNHFERGALSHVSLVILVASMSSSIADFLLNAGVRSVIEFCGSFSLQFSIVDSITGTLTTYLAEGYNVADSVLNTLNPHLTTQPRDPLDSVQIPAIAFTGDGTTTIA